MVVAGLHEADNRSKYLMQALAFLAENITRKTFSLDGNLWMYARAHPPTQRCPTRVKVVSVLNVLPVHVSYLVLLCCWQTGSVAAFFS